MQYEYHLKIANLYSIPIGNVTKIVSDVVWLRKVRDSLWKLETRIKTKKTATRVRV